jgi:hypothetical protein
MRAVAGQDAGGVVDATTAGVVHANVGQKLLNCDKIMTFLGDQ